jgi:hypothetical protein
MGDVILAADCHVGNFKRFGGPVTGSVNTRCQETLDAFEAAVQIAIARKAETFIVAGDLFDYSRPEAPILRAVQRSLKSLNQAGVVAYLMVGNHDQISTAPGDHALAPLAPYAKIVEQPRIVRTSELELWLVPFQQGHAFEWLPGVLSALLKESSRGAGSSPPTHLRRALGLHLGIRDAKTPPWLAKAPDAVDIDLLFALCKEHAIANVFAGNWHDRRSWTAPGVNVFQLGALCPTGWDNPGLDGFGTVGILDKGGAEYEEIPGPRFLKVPYGRDVTADIKRGRSKGHRLYVSMTADPDALAAETAKLTAMIDMGNVAGGEVLPDTSLAKIEATTAAFAATSAQTLSSAIEGFVGAMPLDESIDRASVLQRVVEYLR